jgi:hypothetical protein
MGRLNPLSTGYDAPPVYPAPVQPPSDRYRLILGRLGYFTHAYPLTQEDSYA